MRSVSQLRTFFIDNRGVRAGLRLNDDGTGSGLLVRGNHVDVDAHLAQRLRDFFLIPPSEKSQQHHLAPKLPEDPRDIAAFAARLRDAGLAALHAPESEVAHLQNPVDGT